MCCARRTGTRWSASHPAARSPSPLMVDVFLEPWREPILREALIEMVLVGVACGALGVWIVLYGLSYSAESLAHAMFPGLAVAALLGVPLVLGGAIGLAVAGVAI